MNFASSFTFTRLLGRFQTSMVKVQNLQNFQARIVGQLRVAGSERTCLQRCMSSASDSADHQGDLVEKIESFGLKNFRHKYDLELLKEVCSKFLSVGVEKDDLIRAFCNPAKIGGYSDPPVFTINLSSLQKLLNVFINHNIEPKAIIRVVHYYGSYIKTVSPSELDATLAELASLQFLDTPITNFLDVCPRLIYYDAEMDEKLGSLRDIFPKKELNYLLRNAPNVLTDPWEITQEKLSYIHREMGYDQPHIAYNKTLSFSIQHIKDRHEAMVRTGTFTKPKLQQDRLSHLINHKMEFIMEASDEQFCKRILKIPFEDYESFLGLLHRERQEDFEGVQLDDYESDEDEVLEQAAQRSSYGQRPKRNLGFMPKKDYQRWLLEQ